MIKNILILGPIARNQKIISFIEKKKYFTHFTNSKISESFILKNKIDMIITSGYPFLVKRNIISSVKIAINLHISYLPFGRGIMPNLWSFIDNLPPGITIHKLDKNFDTGKIILQKKIKFKLLEKQTLKSTHDFLILSLEKFFLNNFDKIIKKKFKPFNQNKFYNYNLYRNRRESEKILKNFKKKWNTKILTVIKHGKKNKSLS
tara:strand:+ start:2279 stop:2890 length:612 start_codon:yes stop_codon:yes gene_type:complete